MGHREDLLEGAKRCLLEKGYGRTTARDVVAASGTNLASIGYHYGSKDALLRQAYLALTEERGARVIVALDRGEEPEAEPYRRFRELCSLLVGTAGADRPLRRLQTEVVTRLDDDEELREAIREPGRRGRLDMAEEALGIDPEAEPEKARAAGLLLQALAAGVTVQWLADPETAPTADDLVAGLRAVMGE
ncbi:helix-turn-helix domain-containing protein [Streptomyces sp. NPDC035033]|uniref:TetR/AcrR family transcriptional regulator n=1 Tax=Streptomyces sp. NPDC035033 TaxID=3155368 RepID=UPI0033DA5970